MKSWNKDNRNSQIGNFVLKTLICGMFANGLRLPADRVIKVNIFLTGKIALVAGS